MFNYWLEVSLADQSDINNNQKVLLERAAIEASNRINAKRKGINYEFKKIIDDKHFLIILSSRDEIIPTRTFSSFTRSIVDLDFDNIITSHGIPNRIFFVKEVKREREEAKKNITDSEMLNILIDLTLNQNLLSNNDKKLAIETIKKIKKTLIDFLNNKEDLN
ncbi:hypothetical protein ACKA01_05010 [Helcococcus kunzii]|uniref:hypothetical protein n=1 Tax=Helcococcus kunzii TaxID=40091 RepID=UPI00389FE7CB